MQLLYHDEVVSFIHTLQKPTKAKMVRSFDLVEEYGIHIGMPHIKKINNTLYELRIRGQEEVRILFIQKQTTLIFLHGFVKKTQKTPQKEIETAIKRHKSLTHI